MKKKEVWIVIPAHNEAKNISKVIDKTRRYAKNIVVVDDGSKDNTFSAAKRKKGIIALKHIVNLGKGAALKTGCDYAIMNGAEKIIALDADGQHDPKEIPRFIRNLGKYDIIFGYRKLNKKMPFVMKLGNHSINKITKLLYGIDLKDTQCGYRAFTGKAYKKIRWESSDYAMESEMIVRASKTRLKYKEIPVETIYADNYKGTTVIDGTKITLKLLSWKFLR